MAARPAGGLVATRFASSQINAARWRNRGGFIAIPSSVRVRLLSRVPKVLSATGPVPSRRGNSQGVPVGQSRARTSPSRRSLRSWPRGAAALRLPAALAAGGIRVHCPTTDLILPCLRRVTFPCAVKVYIAAW